MIEEFMNFVNWETLAFLFFELIGGIIIPAINSRTYREDKIDKLDKDIIKSCRISYRNEVHKFLRVFRDVGLDNIDVLSIESNDNSNPTRDFVHEILEIVEIDINRNNAYNNIRFCNRINFWIWILFIILFFVAIIPYIFKMYSSLIFITVILLILVIIELIFWIKRKNEEKKLVNINKRAKIDWN